MAVSIRSLLGSCISVIPNYLVKSLKLGPDDFFKVLFGSNVDSIRNLEDLIQLPMSLTFYFVFFY